MPALRCTRAGPRGVEGRVMRAWLVLVLLAGTAAAQPGGLGPQWTPDHGWATDINADFEARRDQMRREHQERVRKMDEDFDRDTNFMFGLWAVLAVVVLGAAIIGGAVRIRRDRRSPHAGIDPVSTYAPAIAAAPATVDITALRIGIDGRASKFVRTELEAIAKTYAGDDAETRARKLREVSVMLRRVRDSWIYGGADNEPMRPRADAFAAFARHVDEARTRVRKDAQAVIPPSATPVSLILVSVIVAARGELMTVTDLATGEDLRRALEAAAHRAADEILALEVIWVPDGEAQQISSLDLEAVYRKSELHPLEGAVVGKVFCKYCSGPFPAELVSCPHCGGPAPGRERRA